MKHSNFWDGVMRIEEEVDEYDSDETIKIDDGKYD